MSRRTAELEHKYAAMRQIGDWVDSQWNQHRKLLPPHDRIGWGGADFDYLLKATVGESYLRSLRKGNTPEKAKDDAADEGNECVKIWNERTCKGCTSANGRYELKRWDKSGEMEADTVHLRFLALMRG